MGFKGLHAAGKEALQKLSGVLRHPNGTRAGGPPGESPHRHHYLCKVASSALPQLLPARFPRSTKDVLPFLSKCRETTRLPSETIAPPPALQTCVE